MRVGYSGIRAYSPASSLIFFERRKLVCLITEWIFLLSFLMVYILSGMNGHDLNRYPRCIPVNYMNKYKVIYLNIE